MVDEPEEEAPPLRPPRMSLSAAVRDTVAMLRNVPPGDDPYPPSLSLNAAPADRDGLVVSDLRKIYPPRFFGGAAVESVQCAAFGVPTGQVFGLLGANGAGKTTTVSMVCRTLFFAARPFRPSKNVSLAPRVPMSTFPKPSEPMLPRNCRRSLCSCLLYTSPSPRDS